MQPLGRSEELIGKLPRKLQPLKPRREKNLSTFLRRIKAPQEAVPHSPQVQPRELGSEIELGQEAASKHLAHGATGEGWRGRIVANPAVLVGKPVVKGTRLSVDFILSLFSQGWSEGDILDNYPPLTSQDILACLDYATGVLSERKVFPLR